MFSEHGCLFLFIYHARACRIDRKKGFEVFGKTFRSFRKNISKFSGKHFEVFPIPSRRVLPGVRVRSPASGFWALSRAFEEFTGVAGKIKGRLRRLANGVGHFAKVCHFQEILPDCGFLEYAWYIGI